MTSQWDAYVAREMAEFNKRRIDISGLLIAGRKAALAALYDQERNKTLPGSIDHPPESYDGTGALMVLTTSIANVDIGPAIDAAVLEAVVQMGNPEQVATPPLTWSAIASRILRSYCITVAWGLPIMFVLLALRVVLR